VGTEALEIEEALDEEKQEDKGKILTGPSRTVEEISPTRKVAK
jgi:hypothetical protein